MQQNRNHWLCNQTARLQPPLCNSIMEISAAAAVCATQYLRRFITAPFDLLITARFAQQPQDKRALALCIAGCR
jgi:hypothetical protein